MYENKMNVERYVLTENGKEKKVVNGLNIYRIIIGFYKIN